MAKDTGTVNIHGKEYKTVAKRVEEFRNECKLEYSLESEIVSVDEQRVIIKAVIRDLTKENYPIVAIGHAEESRTSSQINKTSALENCETSAYGRALAAFGYAGTEFASADEVANAIHQQNIVNVPYKPPTQWVPSKDKPATVQQKEFIANLLLQRQIEKDDMVEYLASQYGILPEAPMSQADAQMILDDLRPEEKQKRG